MRSVTEREGGWRVLVLLTAGLLAAGCTTAAPLEHSNKAGTRVEGVVSALPTQSGGLAALSGRKHNEGVRLMRRRFVAAGPSPDATSVFATLRVVVSGYFHENGLTIAHADRLLDQLARMGGPTGRYWRFRDPARDIHLSETPGPMRSEATWSFALDSTVNDMAALVGDTLHQTAWVQLRLWAAIEDAPLVLEDPFEAETAVTLGEIGDSSRVYWNEEAEAEESGGGEWYPLLREPLTSPPAFSPRPHLVGPLAWAVLRTLGKLAVADIAGGITEAVAQDAQHLPRNWAAVRGYAAGASFGAATILMY